MRVVRWASLGALISLSLVAGCTGDKATDAASQAPMTTASAAASAEPTSAPCRSEVTREALPEWARGGFSFDGSGVPHVFSERGDLIAVLFNYPPTSSTKPGEGTKILWKSRLPQEPAQPLRIEATLDGSTTTVTREISGGAGPSLVQLPTAGCWRLALSWSGHQDRMTLQFRSNTRP
jgi:hypothetical protein